jgi:hypothetical protein
MRHGRGPRSESEILGPGLSLRENRDDTGKGLAAHLRT